MMDALRHKLLVAGERRIPEYVSSGTSAVAASSSLSLTYPPSSVEGDRLLMLAIQVNTIAWSLPSNVLEHGSTSTLPNPVIMSAIRPPVGTGYSLTTSGSTRKAGAILAYRNVSTITAGTLTNTANAGPKSLAALTAAGPGILLSFLWNYDSAMVPAITNANAMGDLIEERSSATLALQVRAREVSSGTIAAQSFSVGGTGTVYGGGQRILIRS